MFRHHLVDIVSMLAEIGPVSGDRYGRPSKLQRVIIHSKKLLFGG
ncbi:hypothetical protein FP2506_05741 [Fulvimarina pelagi HTCC2506]|uniref:Uncharacterized protein n=1 Tax=Fulvimarina pelagi HTCC2506 TaxID=314231 RepID=Q0G7P8_9HYPH|nr:hypothetical protein FP2506_05741 [Fulvimarina pelagi HTCC2506]